jgi:aminoglycoside phosphotransferase family enzyme/predicted kinase
MVAALLADPATHGGAKVTRIDTHGAMIFLAGDRAWKVKRAVRYPYMDYGTLGRRRGYCAAEVRVNRRTAPEIYVGVAPILHEGDTLRVGPIDLLSDDDPYREPHEPEGAEVVEWAVVMRRFEEDELLSTLAARGRLGPDLVEAVAVHVAAFHAEARPVRDRRRGATTMRRIIKENIGELALSPMLFRPAQVGQLRGGSHALLARVEDLLDERAADGHVRRCHGDLHLGNVCLWQGEPVLFDALEFSRDLSWIDVLYDLAFLIMDLEHRGLRPLAHRAFQVWLDANDDLEGLAALPLFLATRAAVRAKIEAAAAAVQPSQAMQRTREREARFYLAGALDALRKRPPRLLAIGGLSGAGKSTVATSIAPNFGATPGALLLRSDGERKRLAGVSPTERLDEHHYQPEATAQVYAAMRARAARALAAGQSVVLDATFRDPQERAAVADLAATAGVPWLGLWLTADADTLLTRVTARRADLSDADVDVLHAQLETASVAAPGAQEPGWHSVAAGGTLEYSRRATLAVLSDWPSSSD